MSTGTTGERRGSRGFTLIELLVSFSALMVVLLGFSRMLLASRVASSTSHEATLAKEAARGMIEVLHGATLADVYASYNTSTADDPVSAPGANFDVRGLTAVPGDADGLAGRILFPEQGGVLSELANEPRYGWVNLELDGTAGSAADVSASYRLLPVVVRVEWQGAGAPGVVEFKTVLGVQ